MPPHPIPLPTEERGNLPVEQVLWQAGVRGGNEKGEPIHEID